MGDWSWTSFTFWSGNIALMEGRKTFCKISRFFSFTNFPSNLTKSHLGHHSRNISTPELMSARSVEHIEYVRNRTAFHFFGTRRRDNTHRSCRWTRRIQWNQFTGFSEINLLSQMQLIEGNCEINVLASAIHSLQSIPSIGFNICKLFISISESNSLASVKAIH